MAKSAKSERRAAKSDESSSGDRRAGSVGERSELAGTRDSGPRRDETAEEGHRRDAVQDSVDDGPGTSGDE